LLPRTEFTNCTVPIVWWVTYFSIFADLFIGSSLALDAMLAQGTYDRWAQRRPCAAARLRSLLLPSARPSQPAHMLDYSAGTSPWSQSRWASTSPSFTSRCWARTRATR
jgi:hypothetical protein